MPVPVSQLVACAAELFDVTPADILGPSRKPEHFAPRAAVAFAAKRAGRGYSETGRQLGGRDHKTISAAVERAEAMRERQPQFLAASDYLVSLARDHATEHAQADIPEKVVQAIKRNCRAQARNDNDSYVK